jgi:hypothetical protein
MGQNTAPICQPVATQTIPAGSSLVFAFQAEDPDGDNLTLTASGMPLSMGGFFGQTLTGSKAEGLFSWIPPVGSPGTYTLTLTATDDGGSPLSCNTTVTINVLPASASLQTICLIEAFAPSGFGMLLIGLPNSNMVNPNDWYTFEGVGGLFEAYSDGTATLKGIVQNTDSADWRWLVDMKFVNRRNWTDWSALGRSYKGSFPEAVQNHPNWDYYEIDNNNSRLIGIDRFMGDTLFLAHMPANYTYGLQFGIGANDKNGELGMSCWFTFSGAYSGVGDVNSINFCRGRVPTFAGKLVLEGAFNSTSDNMNISLVQSGNFPLSQPFANTTYAYQGNETVSQTLAQEMVDWLLLEVRDSNDPNQVISRQAVLLRKDGRIVDTTGNALVEIPVSPSSPYYFSICHRNHLDLMTSDPVLPNASGDLYTFDFTVDPRKLYQQANATSPAAKQMGIQGPWVMMVGDVNGTHTINAADLRKAALESGQTGLLNTDVNMSGTTNQLDFNLIFQNFFKQSQVLR